MLMLRYSHQLIYLLSVPFSYELFVDPICGIRQFPPSIRRRSSLTDLHADKAFRREKSGIRLR